MSEALWSRLIFVIFVFGIAGLAGVAHLIGRLIERRKEAP